MKKILSLIAIVFIYNCLSATTLLQAGFPEEDAPGVSINFIAPLLMVAAVVLSFYIYKQSKKAKLKSV